MRYLTVLAVAVATALSVAPSQAQETTKEGWCANQSNAAHLDRAKTIIKKAYANSRWEDKTPATQSEKNAWRKHSLCLGDFGTKRVRHYQDAREAHFDRHRAEKLRKQAQDAYNGSIDPPGAAYLARLRNCESGGNYSTDTGNGFYGAYQFTLSTWASVGGSGNPAYASPAEQDYRAAVLWRREGSSPWPVCG